MKLYRQTIIIFLMIFAAGLPASATLINGGFETPEIALGAAEDVKEVPGWTLQNEEFVTVFNGMEAAEGRQYLGLTGASAGEIYQQTDTAPGMMYQLDFFYSLPLGSQAASVAAPSIRAASTFGFAIDFGGDLTEPDILVGVVSSSEKVRAPDWQFYSYQFEAETPRTTVLFTNIPNAGYLIDGVSLTAVPEPATMLLLVIGLAGLAGMRRSRGK